MVTSTTSSTAAGIGSSIVGSLTGGTGNDNAKLVNDLVAINKAAEAARLTSRQTLLETQISDFGLLRSSFATLQSAASALSNRDTFDAKAVSIPDTTVLGITKLEAKAVAGDYRLNVQQIAQAQSLAFGGKAGFESPNDEVGKGELVLRFGSWSDGFDDFTVNTKKDGATIKIDDTNNSLTGLRDAINAADIGVQATIVNDGGSYKLLVTAPSGESNELKITVSDDADSSLHNFGFSAATAEKSKIQVQAGADARISVNGLVLTRESNHLTDVIPGMEFDIFSASDETVSINISADKNTAETAIRDFVDTYNTFLKEVEKLVGFNAELEEYGSLRQDPLAKNLLQTVRSMMTSAIPGMSDGFNSLATLGIRTQLDGSLQIVENGTNTDFRAAMDKNFEAVKDLFTPKTSSSDSRIEVTGFSGMSVAGSYDVVIKQPPEKGTLVGGPVGSLSTTDDDYSFTVEVDGHSAATINLPADKTYKDGHELAAEMQSLINMDPALKEAMVGVQVSFENNQLTFTSKAYGASSKVSFTEAGGGMAQFGITDSLTGTTGKDVAGTIDGVEAFGSGNVLLPAFGSKAEGLSMVISPNMKEGDTATINFSRGFAGQMDTLINNFLKSSGLIAGREENINKGIEDVKDDTEVMERRSEAFRARLESQFIAMEAIVRSLNNTGNFLEGLNDRLPFTSKR